MKPHVIFIVGLPGSGKTHTANAINTPQEKNYLIIDDPNERSLTHLLDSVDAKLNIILCDPNLCDDTNRSSAKLIFSEYDIEWYFFENDVEKCNVNLKHRNDGRNIKNFESFNYTIPEGEEVHEIWQPIN